MHILSDFAGRQNQSQGKRLQVQYVTPTDLDFALLTLSMLSLSSYDGTQLLHVQFTAPARGEAGWARTGVVQGKIFGVLAPHHLEGNNG